MSFGYALIGKAGSLSSLLPSLIGILADQEDTSPEDRYFARFDIDDYQTGWVEAVRMTQWVVYDSIELGQRDPILAVKGRAGAHYIPLSEMIEIAQDTADEQLLEKLSQLAAGRTTGWGIFND